MGDHGGFKGDDRLAQTLGLDNFWGEYKGFGYHTANLTTEGAFQVAFFPDYSLFPFLMNFEGSGYNQGDGHQ
jgi:hypothetical protein